MLLNAPFRASALGFAACLFGGGFGEGAAAQTAPVSAPPAACFTPPVEMVGSASLLADGQYQLTPHAANQIGAVWSRNKINLASAFDYSFWVYLGDNPGGGDGLSFTLQADPRETAAIGQPGRGLGAGFNASLTGGIARSLSVEIDTLRHTDFGWSDPAGAEHVAVFRNGDNQHPNLAGIYITYPAPHTPAATIQDGRYHLMRVRWTPSLGSAQFVVSLNHVDVASYFFPAFILGLGSNMVHWGFTASTGATPNRQSVCGVTLPFAAPQADYGDAPESYGQAWHLRPAGSAGIHMSYDGAEPSLEQGPRFSADGLLDTQEDSLFSNVNPLWSGGRLPLRGRGGGYLNAWVDWSRNGRFEANEQVVANLRDNDAGDLVQDAQNLMQAYVAPRPDLMTGGEGQSFIRLRWSSQPNLGPLGEAPDGEIEDHPVRLALPRAHVCAEASSGNRPTSGTGLHWRDVFWLDWSCGAVEAFNAGDTVERSWTLPSGHVLIGRIANLMGSLRPYAMGSYATEPLRTLHAGLGRVGLASVQGSGGGNAPNVPFRLSLELRAPDGTLLPYGLTTVAAEAEEAIWPTESLALTTNGEPWSIIETQQTPGAVFSDAGRTVQMGHPQSPTSGMVVASRLGSTIDAVLDPGGVSVGAFGVFVGADYGDAPASYGAAAHVVQTLFAAGDRPTAYATVSSSGRAALLAPELRLGAAVTTESAAHSGASATGDVDDGVSFSRNSGGLPLFDTTADTLVSVSAFGGGHLRVWADWNRNGIFDPEELVATDLRDGGPGDLSAATGTIAFNLRAPATARAGATYLRFRWSAAAGASATAALIGGEVEDYRVTVVQPPAAPLACPAGHVLRDVIRNGALTTSSSDPYVWPEWSHPSSGWSSASPGFYMLPDAQNGVASQANIVGLGRGPSALGGGVLTLDLRWLAGAASNRGALPSRLAVLVDGVEYLVLESGTLPNNIGRLSWPTSNPGVYRYLPLEEWENFRVDLPPLAAASSTLSLSFAPPGGGFYNDDFQVRNIVLQACRPQGDLRLEMRASSMAPSFDAPMEFEIYAHNEGIGPVTGLVVRDLLPSGYVFISAAANQGSYVASTGLWTVGEIPAGQSRLLRLTAVPVTGGVWKNVAEATVYTHEDPDSTPNNGVVAEHDYATLTPVPYNGPLPPLPTPVCSTGEAARQILTNSGLSGWTGSAWPGWSMASNRWAPPGTGLSGAHISHDTASDTLSQSGLTNLDRGPSLSGAGLVNLDLWWRNGAPAASSPSASLTISLGGRIYARATSPVGGGTSASVAYFNGATGSIFALTERAVSSFQIHLPADAAASGDLELLFQPTGSLSDDFRLMRAGVYVCGGDLVLSPSHESSVPAGQLAIYPHHLKVSPAFGGGALSFTATSDQGLGWVLRKDDGDGIFNAALDLPWSPGAPIAAGSHAFWLAARIPQNAPGGWRDATKLRAILQRGGLSAFSEVLDVTRVGGGGEGQIHARKTVAPDPDCDGRPDAAAVFVSEIPVSAGACVVYRIFFENLGVEPALHVRVHDHTPDWTSFISGSAQVPAMPPGLSSPTAQHPAEGAEGPILFVFEGALQPGASGAVQFGVRLLGGAPSGGGTGPAN